MDTNYAYNVGRFLLFYFQLEGEIQIFGFRQRLLKLTASLFFAWSEKKIRTSISTPPCTDINGFKSSFTYGNFLYSFEQIGKKYGKNINKGLVRHVWNAFLGWFLPNNQKSDYIYPSVNSSDMSIFFKENFKKSHTISWLITYASASFLQGHMKISP